MSDCDSCEKPCPTKEWFYTETVKDHFFNPRNIFRSEEEMKEFEKRASCKGVVGSPVCGDMMEMWLVIKDNVIKECKWRTFGCASALASTSMLSEMVTANGGLKLEEAGKITPRDILDKLGGLPPRKVHCSVLGDQALQAAIKDYRENSA